MIILSEREFIYLNLPESELKMKVKSKVFFQHEILCKHDWKFKEDFDVNIIIKKHTDFTKEHFLTERYTLHNGKKSIML